jgi:hypothetical protein
MNRAHRRPRGPDPTFRAQRWQGLPRATIDGQEPLVLVLC